MQQLHETVLGRDLQEQGYFTTSVAHVVVRFPRFQVSCTLSHGGVAQRMRRSALPSKGAYVVTTLHDPAKPPMSLQEALALVQDIQTARHRAITLSRRVALNPYVVDAQIVCASADAVRLYGYTHVQNLLGRWQSQLQHPADTQLARAMAIRRHFGYEAVPQEYVSRIRRGNSNRFRHVRKRILQFEYEGETYWATILEEASHAPLLADVLDIERAFPLKASADIQQYSGVISVAEMEERIRLVHDPFSGLTGAHSSSMLSDAMHPTAAEKQRAYSTLDLTPGESIGLTEGSFLHRCGQCGISWLSNHEDPRRCPRHRADSRGPRCGTHRWRVRGKEPGHEAIPQTEPSRSRR